MTTSKSAKPIQVAFRVGIRANGELTKVTLSQEDQRITLTQEQVKSLVVELQKRFP